jgi:hypothetical protein
MPQQIDRSESGDDIGEKLDGMYLAVYFFFFESHCNTKG